MQCSVGVGKRGAVHFLLGAVVFAATAFSTNAAFNARLQGQSRGNTAWLDGNLQGWRDLDAIPCRVYFTGGPANNKVITGEFDHTQGRKLAVHDLYGFTPSANVAINTPTVLSAPPKSSRRTYPVT